MFGVWGIMSSRLNPEYDQAMNNLANILKDERKLTEAELLLRRAVRLRNTRIKIITALEFEQETSSVNL
uniref:Uncharacterized protein n=1 Tax=Timema tahoe TaxID=61484 RepID=A0A7R9IL12_9NEOP|nr:unnamed protein product [Timema tahoe]